MTIGGGKWRHELNFEGNNISPDGVISLEDPKHKDLRDAVAKHVNRTEKFNERHGAAERQFWAIVNSVQTTKRLIEVWPAIEQHVPVDNEMVYPITGSSFIRGSPR